MDFVIDGLQYANWSKKVFKQMRAGNVDAVHVTITYHENFRETVLQIEKWNRFFEEFPDLIFQGKTAADLKLCLLYTSPSPRDMRRSRMPSSA